MLRKVIFVCCGTLLACAAAGTAWATTYSFVQLAPLGADLRDYAFGVNAVGGVPEVVGKSGPILGTAYYQGTPAIWNSAGVGTSILADIPSSPFAAVSATATGVDSSGNVVGVGSSTTSSTTSMKDAFYLAAGGSLATVLPNLTANTTTPYAYSMATGINAGIIVGESVYTDGNTHAVVWTQTGGTWGVTDLDPNVTSNSNFAYAVNSGGVVVGTSIVNSKQDPVTWTYSGGSWTLNDLINRGSLVNAAEALAINDNGVAVGWSSLATVPSSTQHAVMFSGGNAVSLGGLGSSNPTTDQAQGVNDSGVIVGESAIASGTSHAFVYGLGGNNTMQDMNTVFGSSGYNIIPSGWTLTDAYGIDNDGDIAGFASNGTYNRAFLIAASVPEPCTLLLAAIGLAGLLAYAWKKRQ